MSATQGVSMISSACRHWRVEIRNDIAWLTIAVADRSANVLGRGVLLEFDQILSEIREQSLKGVVIRSAKKSGFIAGADIREFEHIDDPAVAADLARTGQRILGRLAALPFPSVAAVHGFCLGGGLELALACTYRVARDDADTRFGLPEVKLGIHPGFAGTIRLPRLIGDLPALEMMLTGRTVSSKEARRHGLADDVVPERHLLRAAEVFIRENPGRRRAAWIKRLPSAAPFRPLVVKMLSKRVATQAHPDHYPAPYRILELWKQQATEEQEAISLGELLVSRTSRNLVHVFLMGEELKRHGGASQHGIRNVHVVGAGTMGGDIAMWAASKGFSVTLQDQTPAILARAMKRAYDYYKKRLKEPRAVQDAMDRLMPDLAGNGLTRADLVIEAIVENVEAKQSLFRDVERRVPKGALLATNTSSIPLETIAQGLSDPSRLVGLHFFNPVAKMQLVEIVRGAQSAEAGLARARSFTAAIDRLPLDVHSSPGFLVNRILMPYLLEAVTLAEEGAPLKQIDDAATTFGMPMGPIELADVVGIDLCLSVAQFLSGPLGVEVPKQLADKVAAGKFGKKSGEGFYKWDSKGRPVKPPVKRLSHVPVTERLILRLLNEAVACLREGVVKNPDDVDAGMVYGTGFPPFLGGPMRYIASRGETGVSDSLYRLSQEYDKRFTPDPGWSQLQSLTFSRAQRLMSRF
jgi:3-hydroxyacyl-CoA dehydrogenase/enoyl-CoA hydratase/3-hydroxybutyryl-CoA epimerase